MNKRILDPLPPEYWLLRIMAINLISVPLTFGACLLISRGLSQIIVHYGVNELVLIYCIYCLWTLLIAISWRLRETHSLTDDLSKIVILTAISGFFTSPLIYLILFFWERI